MTEREKKTIQEAMRTISAGAKKASRMATEGSPLPELSAQLEELRRVVNGVADSIGKAAGAENVLSMATARAKTLSSSKRS